MITYTNTEEMGPSSSVWVMLLVVAAMMRSKAARPQLGPAQKGQVEGGYWLSVTDR